MKPAVGKMTLAQDYARFWLNSPTLPTKRFVIFGSGRSGSTLLVNLLNSSGQVYCDGEILNRASVIWPNLFIKVQASRCSKPIYGFKLLDYQLKQLQKVKDPEKFLVNLHREGWQFIYLTRRNKLNYALSILNALHRKGFHHHSNDGKLRRQKLTVDVQEALYWIKQGEKQTQYYDKVLEKIPHIKLTYEDNLKNGYAHQDTANRVFEFLEIARCQVESNLVKLMPSDPLQMIENSEVLVQTLEQEGYAHFLEPA